MKRIQNFLIASALAFAASPGMAAEPEPVQHPERIATADLAKSLFSGPRAVVSKDEGGGEARDVQQLRSADRKWMSGAYKVVGHNVMDYAAKGYEVNEFMVFISGGVTLTSPDGNVLKIGPGVVNPEQRVKYIREFLGI